MFLDELRFQWRCLFFCRGATGSSTDQTGSFPLNRVSIRTLPPAEASRHRITPLRGCPHSPGRPHSTRPPAWDSSTRSCTNIMLPSKTPSFNNKILYYKLCFIRGGGKIFLRYTIFKSSPLWKKKKKKMVWLIHYIFFYNNIINHLL